MNADEEQQRRVESGELIPSPGIPGAYEVNRNWMPPRSQVDLAGLVVNKDGAALRAGPIEGDAQKERILAEFCEQLYREDEE